MKKLLTAFCLAAAFSAPAQTLFTYGKEAVSATDFLRAFQKSGQKPVTEKTLKEYLDLYIASRLKIREAKERGFDTLPQLVADLSNLRQQILFSYLDDKESMDQMVQEAFRRSQKDIRIAHIFIKEGGEAEKKKEQVLQALAKGDFAKTARQFSDDPSAQANGGDIGWITVFSLPYELESLAYTTPIGKVSAPYKTKGGYHIFKNGGERKALGRIRAAQILLALPPGSDKGAKAGLKQTADSLYNRLQRGEDFGKLAAAYSNDVVSAASNGQMTEFGVGEYDPVFENAVLNLSKDGVVSKPFETDHGFHIVRRLKKSPVAATLTAETREYLRKQVEQSDRLQYLRASLAQRVLKETGYQKQLFSDVELEAYADSVLLHQVPKVRLSIHPSTPLLTIGKDAATAADWTEFVQTSRYNQDGSQAKAFTQLWDEFVHARAMVYYHKHLEDFNEEFRRQLAEFEEGSLFFEIMQQEVWTPAQADSDALAAYFHQHRNRYNWKESADAVLFYSTDENAATSFYKALQKRPADWRTLLQDFSEQVTVDSNRFELAQLPIAEKQRLVPGILTAPLVNKEDNSVSFAYILQLHIKPEPRSFAEARGLVINDYQAQLEKEWVEKLKKKYPVTIHQNVWSHVMRKAKQKP